MCCNRLISTHGLSQAGRLFTELGRADREFISGTRVEIDSMKALRLVGLTMYDEADETLYERRRSSMEYIALDSHKRYSFVV